MLIFGALNNCTMATINTRYNGLINHESGKSYDIRQKQTFCTDDHEPLVATYDLTQPLNKSILQGRPHTMWRYKELLPIWDDEHIVSLGEGFTPILGLHKLAKQYGMKSLLVKEEGGNPTGSFKSRGLGMAVSKAKELGTKEFCIPTAGNAGSCLLYTSPSPRD